MQGRIGANVTGYIGIVAEIEEQLNLKARIEQMHQDATSIHSDLLEQLKELYAAELRTRRLDIIDAKTELEILLNRLQNVVVEFRDIQIPQQTKE